MLASSPLDPLYHSIGWLLAFFYALPPHSLGVAIILMTFVVMLVQFPLIAKQTRSMIQMQRVQPEIKKIQQEYKDDRQKMNEELMRFYQENKINPVAGCLPLLLILPIGMAVFRSFHQGAQLVTDKDGNPVLDPDTNKQLVKHAGAGLQGHIPTSGTFGRLYSDLCGGSDITVTDCARAIKTSTPHAVHFLSMNLTWSASEATKQLSGHLIQWLPYYSLVALVVATGWYQMRQTQLRQLRSGGPAPPAQMQALTKVLPLVFGLFTFPLNAATTLYFVTSNIWRIGQQQLVLNKIYEREHAREAPTRKKPAAEPPPPPGETSAGPGGVKKPAPGAGTPGGPRGPSPHTARRKKKRKR